jgi:hypothetical protein
MAVHALPFAVASAAVDAPSVKYAHCMCSPLTLAYNSMQLVGWGGKGATHAHSHHIPRWPDGACTITTEVAAAAGATAVVRVVVHLRC